MSHQLDEGSIERGLESIDRALGDYESIVKGSIPEVLPILVQATASSEVLRSECGSSQMVWDRILDIMRVGRSYIMGERSNHLRLLNGVLVFCRNLLAAGKGVQKLAWDEKVHHEAFKIFIALKRLDEDDKEVENMESTILQIFVNGTTNNEEVSTHFWQHFLVDQSQDEFNSFLVMINKSQVILIFMLVNSGLNSTEKLALLLSTTENGKTLMHYILAQTADKDDHHDHSDQTFLLAYSIIETLVTSGRIPDIIKSMPKPEHYVHRSLVTLLKLVDAVVIKQRKSFGATMERELIRTLYMEFMEICSNAVPFFAKSTSKIVTEDDDDHERAVVEVLWGSLYTMLEIFSELVHNEVSKQYLLEIEAIKVLTSLFREAHTHLPKKGKLADIKIEGVEMEYQAREFPLIKGSIISILTGLVIGNKEIQDKIRELHSLDLVLSNCVIDQNNPYIRERAIMCLKYILEGNAENQALIAQLEAKQTVSGDVLDEAGYETTIIDGKVALKKK